MEYLLQNADFITIEIKNGANNKLWQEADNVKNEIQSFLNVPKRGA